MDYLEIMNFCGYDLEAADRMVKEIVEEDVEEVPAESVRP